MATTSETLITAELAADVANNLDPTHLEAFVAAVPEASVPLYLARLVDAATNVRTLTKGFERRLVADGMTGKRFTVEGVEYGFWGSVRKGYQDFPGLVRFLIEDCGIAAVDIAATVSNARVTGLRDLASMIPDAALRELALEEIEAHRVQKGERGEPRFQLVNERFLSKGESDDD